jgi:peptidylprolyl isomerase
MGTPVRDRSGRDMPSKAERRALGKAAARKRAAQRRRRELLNRVAQIAGPVVAIAAIIGLVWFFAGGEDPATTTPQASTTSTAPAAPTPTPWTLPEGLDPQLGTRPEVGAGDGTPLTELKVTTLIAGTGEPLQNGQTVTVNYVGVSYATGEEFDASWNRGQPFEFQLGGGVIDGWNQGLVGVPVGSRVQLDIPVTLAYNNQPGYPEGDLRFVVDVLSAS